jgi:ABC-type cobalamin/Fe3+-siderophores transport system ATPase subunit
MRLCALDVVGLRSIDHASLESCGNFNVLIGKNNSGKSNLLAAIDHFFRFLSRETLATTNSSLSEEVDHHKRDVENPIRITATLMPEFSDLEQLFADVAEEFPQVREALPSPERFTQLEIQLIFSFRGGPLAYINSIKCREPSSTSAERSVLTVSEATARQIASGEEELQTLNSDVVALQRFATQFDEEDWERLRSRRTPVTPRLRSGLSPKRLSEIVAMMQRTRDIDEARSSIETMGVSLRTRAEEIQETTLDVPLEAFAGAANVVPEYVTRLLARLKKTGVLHLADQRKPIGETEASRLLDLKVSRGGDTMLRSIQSIVNSLLGVKIDAFTGDRSARTNEPYFRTAAPGAELDVDEFLVQVNGSGIREALRLILDLEFEKPRILLVEEPEVHLHPALEVAMMRYLKDVSNDTQVFLTTHSTNFLDTGDMNNVYMVRLENSTAVHHLDITDAETEIPKELGIRLSSIFMFDQLIFVEGVSDEQVLRSLAQTLEVNLSQANVGFVVMGGARNFTHYAAKATLSLLSRRRVRSIFDKLAQQLGDQAELHVLQKREIENYLIQPDMVAEYINGRRPSIEPISTDDVSAVLDEVAEGLLPLSIAKRVAAIACGVHRADRDKILEQWRQKGLSEAADEALERIEKEVSALRGKLSECVAEVEASINKNWKHSKLDIVPGHELLDGVFNHYGLRFKKDRDAGELARRLNSAQISPELKSLINNLTSNS